MTQFAVHSLHAPPVEWFDGYHLLDGKTKIPLGDPTHVAHTFEAAEQ